MLSFDLTNWTTRHMERKKKRQEINFDQDWLLRIFIHYLMLLVIIASIFKIFKMMSFFKFVQKANWN